MFLRIQSMIRRKMFTSTQFLQAMSVQPTAPIQCQTGMSLRRTQQSLLNLNHQVLLSHRPHHLCCQITQTHQLTILGKIHLVKLQVFDQICQTQPTSISRLNPKLGQNKILTRTNLTLQDGQGNQVERSKFQPTGQCSTSHSMGSQRTGLYSPTSQDSHFLQTGLCSLWVDYQSHLPGQGSR